MTDPAAGTVPTEPKSGDTTPAELPAAGSTAAEPASAGSAPAVEEAAAKAEAPVVVEKTAAASSAAASSPAPAVSTETPRAPRPRPAAAEAAAPAAVKAAPAAHENPIKSAVHEIADEFINPDSPLGPFMEPHSTMIAGIEEHIGYIPGWLLGLMILAVLLAMIMWIPTSY